MATLFPEQFPGIEGKWDIPHLMRLDSNLINCYVANFKLSPTALLPGNWVLWENNGPAPFIYEVFISSDTAIEFMYGRTGGGNPGFAAQGIAQLGFGGGPGTQQTFEAEVKAAVAFSAQFGGGFTGANVRTPILNKAWIMPASNSGFYLKTAAVAANVYVEFHYVEFTH